VGTILYLPGILRVQQAVAARMRAGGRGPLPVGNEGYAHSRMRTYEAALSRLDNLAQVKAAIRLIERIGGTVQIASPTATGMTLVVLRLPETYRPDDVLPGLPFYPV